MEDEEELPAFKDVDASQFLSEATPTAGEQKTAQPQQKASQQEKEEKKSTEKQVSSKPSRETAVAQPMPDREQKDRAFASPFAKKLAYERGIDISKVSASGPSGRIVANDVLVASEAEEVSSGAVSGSAAYTDIKLSNIRKASKSGFSGFIL